MSLWKKGSHDQRGYLKQLWSYITAVNGYLRNSIYHKLEMKPILHMLICRILGQFYKYN